MPLNSNPSVPQGTNAITLAIVDDHAIWRDLLSKMAGQLGYKVAFTAINGVDCILRIQTVPQKNLVCIIDVEMPIMNGYEATRQIKAKYPDARIVALSIKNDPITIEKITQCGADGFIQKGATAAMFQTAINAAANSTEQNSTTADNKANNRDD